MLAAALEPAIDLRTASSDGGSKRDGPSRHSQSRRRPDGTETDTRSLEPISPIER